MNDEELQAELERVVGRSDVNYVRFKPASREILLDGHFSLSDLEAIVALLKQD